jgi:hypothetical protein
MTEEMLIEKAINVVVVNRFCELIPLPDLLKWKAKLGFKLVVDIDDYWELFSQHLSAPTYRSLGVTQVIKNYIKVADVVTTTHNRLRLEIIKINPNCYILPNALPFDRDQFTAVRNVNEFMNYLNLNLLRSLHGCFFVVGIKQTNSIGSKWRNGLLLRRNLTIRF